MRPIFLLMLLGLAAFCAFGFAATFEPIEGSQPILWRVAYGVIGMTSFAYVARTLIKGRGAPKPKGSGE